MIYYKILLVVLLLVDYCLCSKGCLSSDEEVETETQTKLGKTEKKEKKKSRSKRRIRWDESDDERDDLSKNEKRKDYDPKLFEIAPVESTTWPSSTFFVSTEGFKNINNSCFLNASIQALLANDLIAEVLLSNSLKEFCSGLKESETLKAQDFICALVNFIYSPHSTKAALRVQETLVLAWPDWNDPKVRKRQQDAHEVLNHIINHLKVALAPIVKNGQHRFTAFTGELRSTISAPNEKSKPKNEEFNMIELSLTKAENTKKPDEKETVKKGPLSVVELLTNFKEAEALKDYKNAKDAKRGYLISKSPSILILNFKRFTNNLTRIGGIIQTEPYLNLRPFVTDATSDEPILYELFAVIVQKGQFNEGHYYTYVKETFGSDSCWMKRDDTTVRPVDDKVVFKDEHYLQFYRRMQLKSQKSIGKS